MLDLDRLFELLEEAVHAVQCNCPTTTKAYMTMAKREWFRMVDDADDGETRAKVRAAALFIDRLTSRQIWAEKPSNAARNAYDFWQGFEDGLRDRTQGKRVSPSFRRGFRFGKDGT